MLRRLSPVHLARLAIGGAMLAALPWMLQWMPMPPMLGSWHSLPGFLWALRLRVLLFGVPFGAGGALALWAQRQLRLGFLDDAWSGEQPEPVRRLVQSHFWKWFALGLFGLCLTIAALSLHHAGSLLLYVVLFPSQMAQTIDRALFPRASRSVSLRTALSDVQPLRSEHWGRGRA